MDAEEIAEKRFNAEDKAWTGPKFIGLGLVTLVIAISIIFSMAVQQGCSLQIVP